MERLLNNTALLSLLSAVVFLSAPVFFAPQNELHTDAEQNSAETILQEVELTLSHYRTWLLSPEVINVVKGTNHAARATVLIDAYLESHARNGAVQAARDGRVGIHGIRALLMKQMRIHVDLLSTNVPVGIVSYDSQVENAVEEQLNLLEQTLREFERHQAGG